MIAVLVLLAVASIAYGLGWHAGKAEGIAYGYTRGRLEMACELDEIKSCDRMMEKILREKYEHKE